MKTEIEKELSILKGLELAAASRAANMIYLKFGKLTYIGKRGIIGEYGLHLQIPWRFANEFAVIVGDGDMYEHINEDGKYYEDYDWDEEGNLCDFKIQTLIIPNRHKVMDIVADNYGGFEILFSSNIKLSVFPNLTANHEYSEFWRLLYPDREKNHFVIGSFGIEEPDDSV